MIRGYKYGQGKIGLFLKHHTCMQRDLCSVNVSPPFCLRRRDEHRPRGDRRPPRRDALLRPVADQQPRGDGLRQPGEGQPRRSPGDGQAEGRATGEDGVHHGGSAGAQQQLLLIMRLRPGRRSAVVLLCLCTTARDFF